jgi:hypothetical protein
MEEETRKALSELTISSFQDIKSIQVHSELCNRLLLALSFILGREYEWASIPVILSDHQTLKRMEEFNTDTLSPEMIDKLIGLFEDHPITEEQLVKEKEPPLIIGIYRWLKALYRISKRQDKEKIEKEVQPKSGQQVSSLLKLPDDIQVEPVKDDRLNDWNLEFEIALESLKMIEKELIASPCFTELNNPTNRITKLISAAAMLINHKDAWDVAKKIFSDCKTSEKALKRARIENVSREKIDLIRVMLQDPELRMNMIQEDCPAACNLLMWITAFINLWVVGQYIESGEIALSEHAEQEARRQESQIIRSHSNIFDETDLLFNDNGRKELYRVERRPSIEDLM